MAITVNTNGFDINFAASIDKRLIVDRVNGTTASLVSLQPVYNYKNMYVWVREEKAFYYLNDVVDQINFPGATVSDWTKLISGSGSVGGSASIDFEEIAFGTGTGITSSNYFTWNNTCNNLIASEGSKFVSGGFSITSPNSAIIGGTGNSIFQGYFHDPKGSNLILGSENSIVATFSNIIGGDSLLSIISGRENIIGYSSQRSTLIAGCENIGRAVSDSAIIGGGCNCIKTSKKVAIIGGSGSFIDQSQQSVIIGGSSNYIINSKSSLISGDSNYIYDSSRSSIIGGAGNSIGTQSQTLKAISEVLNTRNVIIGGLTNEISGTSSYNSSIIGGYKNCVFKSNSSVIIGGIGLTLSSEDSVVYVPKLKIATASNNDSVNKILVWDTDDNYVKWRDASTLGSGGGATGCAKSGYVSGASFTGSPSASATVVFSSPYSSASYSVVVTAHAFNSEDYIYSVINKLSTGFTIRIDSPSTPTPIGATAMWITNCWDGSGLSSGGSGGNAAFLPLPVPKINLMQGTQSVQVYNSATNTISGTAAIIHNYPVLINMDFTSDHFSNPNNKIFIEMVYYRRKSRKTYADPEDLITPIKKKKGKSYVVPAKHKVGEGQDITLPWIAAAMAVGATGSWTRSGSSYWSNGSAGSSVLLGIDRPNHYEITSYTMSSYPIWEYLNGRFEFYNVTYADVTGTNQAIQTLIPNSGKSRAGQNSAGVRFPYSSYYTPYYCAFRYIQWIPSANNGRGQIVSGPLSKVIKVTGLNFPFQTDYQQSAIFGFPVCNISAQWTSNPSDSYRRLKCDWESNLP